MMNPGFTNADLHKNTYIQQYQSPENIIPNHLIVLPVAISPSNFATTQSNLVNFQGSAYQETLLNIAAKSKTSNVYYSPAFPNVMVSSSTRTGQSMPSQKPSGSVYSLADGNALQTANASKHESGDITKQSLVKNSSQAVNSGYRTRQTDTSVPDIQLSQGPEICIGSVVSLPQIYANCQNLESSNSKPAIPNNSTPVEKHPTVQEYLEHFIEGQFEILPRSSLKSINTREPNITSTSPKILMQTSQQCSENALINTSSVNVTTTCLAQSKTITSSSKMTSDTVLDFSGKDEKLAKRKSEKECNKVLKEGTTDKQNPLTNSGSASNSEPHASNSEPQEPEVVDLDTEDIDDCLLVKIDFTKHYFPYANRLNNIEVVIDDSDTDDDTTNSKTIIDGKQLPIHDVKPGTATVPSDSAQSIKGSNLNDSGSLQPVIVNLENTSETTDSLAMEVEEIDDDTDPLFTNDCNQDVVISNICSTGEISTGVFVDSTDTISVNCERDSPVLTNKKISERDTGSSPRYEVDVPQKSTSCDASSTEVELMELCVEDQTPLPTKIECASLKLITPSKFSQPNNASIVQTSESRNGVSFNSSSHLGIDKNTMMPVLRLGRPFTRCEDVMKKHEENVLKIPKPVSVVKVIPSPSSDQSKIRLAFALKSQEASTFPPWKSITQYPVVDRNRQNENTSTSEQLNQTASISKQITPNRIILKDALCQTATHSILKFVTQTRTAESSKIINREVLIPPNGPTLCQTNNGKKPPVICKICSQHFHSRSELVTHTWNCHRYVKQDSYQCKECGKKFISKSLFKLHCKFRCSSALENILEPKEVAVGVDSALQCTRSANSDRAVNGSTCTNTKNNSAALNVTCTKITHSSPSLSSLKVSKSKDSLTAMDSDNKKSRCHRITARETLVDLTVLDDNQCTNDASNKQVSFIKSENGTSNCVLPIGKSLTTNSQMNQGQSGCQMIAVKKFETVTTNVDSSTCEASPYSSCEQYPHKLSQQENSTILNKVMHECINCKKKFENQVQLQAHQQISQCCKTPISRSLNCFICNKIFLNSAHRFMHMWSSPGCKVGMNSYCFHCGNNFNDSLKKQYHLSLSRTCWQYETQLTRYAVLNYMNIPECSDQNRETEGFYQPSTSSCSKEASSFKTGTPFAHPSQINSEISTIADTVKNYVRCEVCKSEFPNGTGLTLHLKMNPACSKSLTNALSKQQENVEGQKLQNKEISNIKCTACKKQFPTNSVLTLHLNNSSKCRTKILKCLKVHTRNSSAGNKKKMDSIQTIGCNKTASLKEIPENRQQNPQTEEISSVKCTACKEQFPTNAVLTDHLHNSSKCQSKVKAQCLKVRIGHPSAKKRKKMDHIQTVDINETASSLKRILEIVKQSPTEHQSEVSNVNNIHCTVCKRQFPNDSTFALHLDIYGKCKNKIMKYLKVGKSGKKGKMKPVRTADGNMSLKEIPENMGKNGTLPGLFLNSANCASYKVGTDPLTGNKKGKMKPVWVVDGNVSLNGIPENMNKNGTLPEPFLNSEPHGISGKVGTADHLTGKKKGEMKPIQTSPGNVSLKEILENETLLTPLNNTPHSTSDIETDIKCLCCDKLFDSPSDLLKHTKQGQCSVNYEITENSPKSLRIVLKPSSVMCQICQTAFVNNHMLTEHLELSSNCHLKTMSERPKNNSGMKKIWSCQITSGISDLTRTVLISSTDEKISGMEQIEVDKEVQKIEKSTDTNLPTYDNQMLNIHNAEPGSVRNEEIGDNEINFTHSLSSTDGDSDTEASDSNSENDDCEYKCRHCSQTFTSKSSYKKHNRLSHSSLQNRSIYCKVCTRKFHDLTGLQAHLLQFRFCFIPLTRRLWEKVQDPQSCNMCKKVLCSPKDLRKHCFKNMTCRLRYINAASIKEKDTSNRHALSSSELPPASKTVKDCFGSNQVSNVSSTQDCFGNKQTSNLSSSQDCSKTKQASNSQTNIDSSKSKQTSDKSSTQDSSKSKQAGNLQSIQDCSENKQVTNRVSPVKVNENLNTSIIQSGVGQYVRCTEVSNVTTVHSKKCMHCGSSYDYILEHVIEQQACLSFYRTFINKYPGQFPYCYKCKHPFDNIVALTNHTCKPSPYVHSCQICGLKFTSENDFNVHISHNAACSKATAVCTMKKNHKNMTVPKKDNTKQDDRQIASTDKVLPSTKKHLSPEQSFQCMICDAKFQTMHLLMGHSYQHAEETPFKCDRCDVTFFHYNRFVSHQAFHIRMDKETSVLPENEAETQQPSNNLNILDKDISKNQEQKAASHLINCLFCHQEFSSKFAKIDHISSTDSCRGALKYIVENRLFFRDQKSNGSCGRRSVDSNSCEFCQHTVSDQMTHYIQSACLTMLEDAIYKFRSFICATEEKLNSGVVEKDDTMCDVSLVPKQNIHCLVCRETFDDQDLLTHHQKEVHGHVDIEKSPTEDKVKDKFNQPEMLYCFTCNKYLKTVMEVERHKCKDGQVLPRSAVENALWEPHLMCKICKHKCNRSLTLINHMLKNHYSENNILLDAAGYRTSQCYLCNKHIVIPKQQAHFYHHRRYFLNSLRDNSLVNMKVHGYGKCIFCNTVFTSRKLLFDHIYTHRKSDIFISVDFTKTMHVTKQNKPFDINQLNGNENQMLENAKQNTSHLDSVKVCCKLCHKKFIHKNAFRLHFKTSHTRFAPERWEKLFKVVEHKQDLETGDCFSSALLAYMKKENISCENKPDTISVKNCGSSSDVFAIDKPNTSKFPSASRKTAKFNPIGSCKMCDKKFINLTLFRFHLKSSHNKHDPNDFRKLFKPIPVEHIKETVETFVDKLPNQSSSHENLSRVCMICHASLKEASKYQDHLKTHIDPCQVVLRDCLVQTNSSDAEEQNLKIVIDRDAELNFTSNDDLFFQQTVMTNQDVSESVQQVKGELSEVNENVTELSNHNYDPTCVAESVQATDFEHSPLNMTSTQKYQNISFEMKSTDLLAETASPSYNPSVMNQTDECIIANYRSDRSDTFDQNECINLIVSRNTSSNTQTLKYRAVANCAREPMFVSEALAYQISKSMINEHGKRVHETSRQARVDHKRNIVAHSRSLFEDCILLEDCVNDKLPNFLEGDYETLSPKIEQVDNNQEDCPLQAISDMILSVPSSDKDSLPDSSHMPRSSFQENAQLS